MTSLKKEVTCLFGIIPPKYHRKRKGGEEVEEGEKKEL
jgi:hypothetical protein